METQVEGRTLRLIQGDITDQATDAIVNAANSRLTLGGGVAGAIRSKGGAEIQAECDRIGSAPVGGAVITTGGRLEAGRVIHAVGPMMGEGDEDAKLRNAILNSLRVADENGLGSITFPAVSTGIFGFPIERGAGIMLAAAMKHLGGDTGLELVQFCLFGPLDFDVFVQALEALTR